MSQNTCGRGPTLGGTLPCLWVVPYAGRNPQSLVAGQTCRRSQCGGLRGAGPHKAACTMHRPGHGAWREQSRRPRFISTLDSSTSGRGTAGIAEGSGDASPIPPWVHHPPPCRGTVQPEPRAHTSDREGLTKRRSQTAAPTKPNETNDLIASAALWRVTAAATIPLWPCYCVHTTAAMPLRAYHCGHTIVTIPTRPYHCAGTPTAIPLCP